MATGWGIRLAGAGGSADALRTAGNRLLRETAGQAKGTLAALTVATLVQVGVSVLAPRAIGTAVDAAGSGTGLTRALAWLGGLLALTMAVAAADDLLSAYLGSGLTALLRHRLLSKTLSLGIGGQRRFPPGEILHRLAENANGPASAFPLLLTVVATLLSTAGAVVGLALIDLRLAGTFLVGVPLAVELLRRFARSAGGPMLDYQRHQAAIVTRLLDAHHGARTIRASGTADRDVARILAPLPDLHDSGEQVWAAQRKASWQVSLLVPMVQVVVLAVGGIALAEGSITAGQLIAASSYVTLALGAVGLFDTIHIAMLCQVGAGRVAEVLDSDPDVAAPLRPRSLPRAQGQLRFSGVTVYSEDRTVLDRLELTVPGGSSVALVGRSGAGKSTLAALPGRLRDPDAGSVLLDGVDVSQIALPDLRRSVSYAFERPALLGTTVADMIAYGRPEASRADIERAAEIAQAAPFIRALPDGYDTPLERAPLSGGELQRLGLARAVLTAARLVVLDDATSSLDTATELSVSQALRRVLAGRTALIVAHRVATAARADLVAWLDGGRIRALGPHRELWSDAAYRAMFAADADAAHTASEGREARA